jgi:hypothetical protein
MIERAMSNTSGGRGKKDDSATALRKSAAPPYGVEAHEITHPTNPSDAIITLSSKFKVICYGRGWQKSICFTTEDQSLILQRTSYPLLRERS